jgi:hypothetical protein
MAFVVARPHGRYEIRESRHTPAGPRARTLATFRVLTPDVLAKARGKARGDFDVNKIRARAAELNIPERAPNAACAARTLLRELRAGDTVPPVLVHELRRALPEAEPIPETIGDAPMWIDADVTTRARALYDLLDLGSYLPIPRRPLRSAFPRLSSEP